MQALPLPLSEITVAEVMQEAGYSTALFGKWHLGDFKPLKGGNKKWPVYHPGLHGFDQCFATEVCTDMYRQLWLFPTQCIYKHYPDHPSSTNYYYTNKFGGIEDWPEVILEGDSHFIWSLTEYYIKEQSK